MTRWRKATAATAVLVLIGGGSAFAATLSGSTLSMSAGDTVTATCPNRLSTSAKATHSIVLSCAPKPATTTTIPTSVTCTDPIFSTGGANGTINIDPSPARENWWVNNDVWNASHGPQTMNVCSQSSWYAVSDQPNDGGAVETYPDTEYDVGGRNNLSTKPISQFTSITSTFSESFPSAGSWDAAYDLWLNNWSIEVMIWNQWAGSQAYWPGIATQTLTLDGVPYRFYKNGAELMLFRGSQTTSGTVHILAAFHWLESEGYVSSSDVPTQLEYGVEVASTSGSETFPMTGLTFNLK